MSSTLVNRNAREIQLEKIPRKIDFSTFLGIFIYYVINLEFAPISLFPVTKETHFLAGKGILFKALSSSITALGEHICGHSLCDFQIDDYRKTVEHFPMDISFATTSITIGFEELAHYTSVTKSKNVRHEDLISFTLVEEIGKNSDFPRENIFINATPANFPPETVPRAGENKHFLLHDG